MLTIRQCVFSFLTLQAALDGLALRDFLRRRQATRAEVARVTTGGIQMAFSQTGTGLDVDAVAALLEGDGYETVADVRDLERGDLLAVEGFDAEPVYKLLYAASQVRETQVSGVRFC